MEKEFLKYGFNETKYDFDGDKLFYKKETIVEHTPFGYYINIGYVDFDDNAIVEIYEDSSEWYIQCVVPSSGLDPIIVKLDSEEGQLLYNKMKTV